MEPQFAVALADGLEHDAHAVAEVVAHHAPHEQEREENTDWWENQVEIVDIRHRERLTQQPCGEVQQVLDNDGRSSSEQTDNDTENQHSSSVREMILDKSPALGHTI